MAIDAVVSGVAVIYGDDHCTRCNGSGKNASKWDACSRCHGATPGSPVVLLALEPRQKCGLAGQARMRVLNPPDPPEALQGVIGCEIWGNSSVVMIGDKKFADRVGHTQIRLME